MTELQIDNGLVGRQVCCPTRPEWGVGKVMRVQTIRAGEKTTHRVSVQFVTGHRTLVVPPAQIALPQEEPEREAGWLDQIGGQTLDNRLTTLPEELEKFFGTPAQHILALAPLYQITDDPASLEKWARRQTGVADALSHWSRDELEIAFRQFCMDRDSTLRTAAARLRQKDGPEAVQTVMATLPQDVQRGMRMALGRVL